MINNDILRRLCTIFNFDDKKTQAVFALKQCVFNAEQLTNIYKEKNDPAYKELLDIELASFLNGLIIEKRGQKDGPEHHTEQLLNNNIIFNKVKIALTLKADEVISILELADISLTKYELSAFFRNINNKHYRVCSDDILSAFLKGLKIKFHS
ncbi:MAG: DUF1456 family protein [Alteromonadaceae bacterium]|nr:DUF1456 family protein [Alteromonadaceae bacterium]